MGVDIHGYSNIEVLTLLGEYDEDLEYEQSYINPHFPHAVPPEWAGKKYLLWKTTENSVYAEGRSMSYGGYGIWRAQLAAVFCDIPDLYGPVGRDEQWNTLIDERQGFPFYEFINFSDCEGTFYGPVCEKLYKDFYSLRETFVDATLPYPAWDKEAAVERYDAVLDVFEKASQNGIVLFT